MAEAPPVAGTVGGIPGRLSYTGLTLAGRLAASFAVVAALMAGSLGTAVWAYNRELAARHHLVNVVDAARFSSESLFADYLNEETGVRGYILSGQKAFLQPWYLGLTGAKAERPRLGKLESQDPASSGLLAGVDAAAKEWQQRFALPAIAATARGDRAYAGQKAEAAGKAAFDDLRKRFALLQNALDASAASSSATLAHAQRVVAWAFVVLLAIIFGSGLAVAWALRSWVTGPLRRLGADVRVVAHGELSHAVDIVGPPDLAVLAGDVDAMRERIVSEVRSLSAVSEELRALNSDLARSNQELEQFAYVASHDLQEPLRKVVSFCQLIEARYQGQLDERGHEYIAYAVDGATRMQVLINDLLAFSRVGRTTEALVEVDLNEAYRHALANLETAVRDSAALVSSAPLPIVNGDLGLLALLFQNLIANAIKFNKSGQPEVAVAAEKVGDYWHISVMDNGIGIEPRFAERVFVIFQRLHSRDAYPGTGIGLAMCRKIVEFHGGRIWLGTGHSPGACITFSLPVLGREG